MSIFADFKKFAFKGNVVDLAVGVIIGAAFGKIVTALVNDIVMPVVSLALPGGDWRNAGIILRAAADPKDNVVLRYGDFVGSVLDFLLVAIVLFIVVAKVFARISKKPEEAPTTKECPLCLESVPLKATRCKACTATI